MRASGEATGNVDTEEEAMEPINWSLIIRLSLVGFFANCQPSEPFLTKYLEDVKGISDQDLDDYVWPCDTYGSFAFLIPVGLLADQCGYRVVVFLGLVCREATRLVLIFGDGVSQMAIMQMTYAAATSADSVYLAYTYMVVPKQHFHIATAAVVAAKHLGHAMGSASCQVLDSFTDASHNLRVYFYISWGFTTISLLCFLVLPPPRNSTPPSLVSTPPSLVSTPPSLVSVMKAEGPSVLWTTMKGVYAQPDSAMCSMWWVTGGVTMPYIISNYYQSQFKHRWHDGPVCLPALAMQILSTLGAVFSPYAAAHFGSCFASISCLILAVLYYLPTIEDSAWMSYTTNTLASAVYNLQLATASAKIAAARHDGDQRYAVVFTTNQCIALGVAAIVNAVGSFNHLHTDDYFRIAGVAEGILAALLAAMGLIMMARRTNVEDSQLTATTTTNTDSSVYHPPVYHPLQDSTRDMDSTCDMDSTGNTMERPVGEHAVQSEV